MMGTKLYAIVSSVIFALVAVAHLSRLVWQGSVLVGTWQLPIWINGIGLVLASYLSYEGFRLYRRAKA
jgi:hypothetical protein